MADAEDSSLFLEEGAGFPAPNNTAETMDNSIWEITRPEFIVPGLPMKYAMSHGGAQSGFKHRPPSMMHRVPTIDSSIGNISAITRASRLSLCHKLDETDMSQDIETPQHSTPEKEKRPLAEINTNTDLPLSPHKKTPPTVTRRKGVCLDERPDPLGRADDSIPHTKKKSNSSSSQSDTQDCSNSCCSRDSHQSWGEPKSVNRQSSHLREHKPTHHTAHRHHQKENVIEFDGYSRRRHGSDSGNHSGSGGECYTSSDPHEYNGNLAKRSYASSMGTGSANSYESLSSNTSASYHHHQYHQYPHKGSSRIRRPSGGNNAQRSRRRSAHYPETTSLPLHAQRNVVSSAAEFPIGNQPSKVKLYTSNRSQASSMNPVHTMIQKRQMSDMCPDASMLTQCNNESWNDRDLMTSILSMNSSLDCQFVYG